MIEDHEGSASQTEMNYGEAPKPKAPRKKKSSAMDTKSTLALLRNEPKVTVVFGETGSKADPTTVVAGINGVMYSMNRGVECDIPVSVAKVIQNAKKTVYTMQQVDGKARRVPKVVPSYPMTIIHGGEHLK